MKKSEKTKKTIKKQVLDYIKKYHTIPRLVDLKKEYGLLREHIIYYFNSYEEFLGLLRKENGDVFNSIIDSSLFSEENFSFLEKEVKKYDTFVITSAVTGCSVNKKALESVNTYCKYNNAKLLVLPCTDPASKHSNNWALDSSLGKDSIVFKDLKLNENFFLSTIKLSAKHINPTTGLSRIGQRQGSFVYASPKQSLEYVATSLEKKIPRALMTTGAITNADYMTDKYMSERTSYIANEDHVLGAIIVEIENNEIFHFRQVQINEKTGEFYDLDKKYSPNGKVTQSKATLVQLGDYHVGETDPLAKQVAKDICDLVQPTYLTVEDFFNGHSVSHHDEGKCIVEAKKAKDGSDLLHNELNACARELDELSKWKVNQIVVKYGNHEDFLYRWLNRGGYINQPQNHALGVKIASALLNDGFHNPFEYAMVELYKIKNPGKVKFLGMNDSFRVNDIENGAHGDLGPNGSRNPGLAGIEKSYGAANVGHTHSAGILRRVFRVGTTSFLKMSYNNGPSSWTQTHLIQHPDGSRQLINCINGKFRINKKRRK